MREQVVTSILLAFALSLAGVIPAAYGFVSIWDDTKHRLFSFRTRVIMLFIGVFTIAASLTYEILAILYAGGSIPAL